MLIREKVLSLIFLLVVFSLFTGHSSVFGNQTQEWPRHRGDSALNGVSNARLGNNISLLWVFDTGEFLKSSVVVSDGIAYVGSDKGFLHAIDLSNGKEKWKFKSEMAIEAPPLIHLGKVIFGSTDSFLYALDQHKGTLLWKYETDGEIMGAANQALRPHSKDDVVLVGSYDNYLHCVDASTGIGIWKFETQNYVNGVPTIFDEKYVVLGGCDAMLYVIGLEDGKEIRSVEVEAPIAASVAVADGVGYVGNMDRSVMAFDLNSGDQVWSYKQKNFPYFSSPAVSESMIFIGGRDKGLHAIDRISGKQNWRFAARGRVDSSPVLAGETLVFGSMDGKLYLVSTKDGKEIASYEIGDAVSSTPAVIDGKIIVGCEDGKVYAFKVDQSL